jgi:hypothetical protein
MNNSGLVNRNGKEYLEYSSGLKSTLKLDESHYFEINRLLINFLSAVSMFIDYGEKYNSKYFGKEKMKEFRSKTHLFYDEHVSYRFIAILRNYALHYGFPLSVIHSSQNGMNGIFASKKALLRFKDWKHVKEDIDKMSELISFDIHIDIAMLFLKHLYESFVYDIAPSVLKGIEHYNKLVVDLKGKVPVLAKTNNEEEYRAGKVLISDLNRNEYIRAFEIIKNNKNIEIIIR